MKTYKYNDYTITLRELITNKKWSITIKRADGQLTSFGHNGTEEAVMSYIESYINKAEGLA